MVKKINPAIAHHFVVDRIGINQKSKKYFNNQEFSIVLKSPFPLGIIFNEEIIQQYNKIFLFLLHLKRAKHAVNSKLLFLKQFKSMSIKEKNIFGGKKAYGADYDFDIGMEHNYDFDPEFNIAQFGGESTSEIKKYAIELSKKLKCAQTELGNFVNIYETFLRGSVIDNNKNEFMQNLLAKKGIIGIIKAHSVFVNQVYDMCFLSKKGENVLDIFEKCLDSCFKFGQVVKDFEQALIYNDDNPHDTLRDMQKVNNDAKELLIGFRKNLALILKLLHSYQQKGIKFQLIEIFTQLNFNNFYLNEYGEVNSSTISNLTPAGFYRN